MVRIPPSPTSSKMSETDDTDFSSTSSMNSSSSSSISSRDLSSNSSSSINESDDNQSLESGEILDAVEGEDDDILDGQENLPNGYVLNANPQVDGNVVEVIQNENEPEQNVINPIPNLIGDDGLEDISSSSLSDLSIITASSSPKSTNNLMSPGRNTDPTLSSGTDPSSLSISPRYEPPDTTSNNDNGIFQRPNAPATSLNTTPSEPDLDVLSLTCSSLSSISSYFPSDGSNDSPQDPKK